MKFRTFDQSTLLAWSPLIVLSIFVALNTGVREYLPELFCSPIDRGGKELVCGFGYSAPIIQVFTIMFYVLYFGGLVFSADHALRGKLTKFGVLGFTLGLLFVVAGFMLASQFGLDDSP